MNKDLIFIGDELLESEKLFKSKKYGEGLKRMDAAMEIYAKKDVLNNLEEDVKETMPVLWGSLAALRREVEPYRNTKTGMSEEYLSALHGFGLVLQAFGDIEKWERLNKKNY
jgi:hypothetical protein